eukprot:scaffold124143_cov63-Phaeocystis_antarctica.AAC.2
MDGRRVRPLPASWRWAFSWPSEAVRSERRSPRGLPAPLRGPASARPRRSEAPCGSAARPPARPWGRSAARSKRAAAPRQPGARPPAPP